MENLPSMKNLRQTLEYMSNQSYKGVPGVLKISSDGEPSPVIGVTAMTHGNEPSGLAAIWHLLRGELLQNMLNKSGKGSVIFSVNNLEAAHRYFSLPEDAEQERADCRVIDVNMNRLPTNVLNLQNDTRSEICRFFQLYQSGILDEFEAGLDIHSLRVSNLQMTVEVKGNGKHFARNFPLPAIITNVIPIQIGHPISKFYGGLDNPIPVVGIEAGQHEHENAFRFAIDSTRSFLRELGIAIGDDHDIRSDNVTEYRVSSSVIPPKIGYHMAQLFQTFEVIEKDTVLLKHAETGEEITAQHSGHIFSAPPPSQALPTTEEACFLTEPKKVHKRSSL